MLIMPKQANQLAIAAQDIADKGGSVTVRAVEAMGEIKKQQEDRGHHHRDRRDRVPDQPAGLNAAVEALGQGNMVEASQSSPQKCAIWLSGPRRPRKRSRD